jgi:hypothetical protein
MASVSNSSPTVTRCLFSGNSAIEGGGMLVQESSPTIVDCQFIANEALYAGGLDNYNNASPVVINSVFMNNVSLESDGEFSGGLGGAILNYFSSTPEFINCTVVANSADIMAGGIYNTNEFGGHCAQVVTNSIVYGNSGQQIADIAGASSTVTYSDIQGGYPGLGNIDADPVFADADYRLGPGSPCIDAGDNAAVPPGQDTDLDGNPRFVDPARRLGAVRRLQQLPGRLRRRL